VKFLKFIGLLAFGVLIAVTLLGVADRFILGLGLVWTEELARYTLIWTSLLAAAVAAGRHAHFRVDVMTAMFGPVYRALIALAAAAICLVAAWYGAQFAWMFRGQHSPALGLSMAWIYAAGPLGLTLIAGFSAADAVRTLKARRAVAPGGHQGGASLK
jgi:TRAP-type C4-dicarboxylate transport system permease small subunit